MLCYREYCEYCGIENIMIIVNMLVSWISQYYEYREYGGIGILWHPDLKTHPQAPRGNQSLHDSEQ